MERVGTLINKLQEQFANGQSAQHLMHTTQMLLAELQQQATNQPVGKVAVTMPFTINNAPVQAEETTPIATAQPISSFSSTIHSVEEVVAEPISTVVEPIVQAAPIEAPISASPIESPVSAPIIDEPTAPIESPVSAPVNGPTSPILIDTMSYPRISKINLIHAKSKLLLRTIKNNSLVILDEILVNKTITPPPTDTIDILSLLDFRAIPVAATTKSSNTSTITLKTKSVEFVWEDDSSATTIVDSVAPFTFCEGTCTDAFIGSIPVGKKISLTVTPYSGKNLSGTAGASFTIYFTIKPTRSTSPKPPPTPECSIPQVSS